MCFGKWSASCGFCRLLSSRAAHSAFTILSGAFAAGLRALRSGHKRRARFFGGPLSLSMRGCLAVATVSGDRCWKSGSTLARLRSGCSPGSGRVGYRSRAMPGWSRIPIKRLSTSSFRSERSSGYHSPDRTSQEVQAIRHDDLVASDLARDPGAGLQLACPIRGSVGPVERIVENRSCRLQS